MIRFIIPLIAVLLFFLEPIFSLFSPIDINDNLYITVPRFLIVYLIFIATYYNSKRAIIYGFVLGLLYDMYHIDIIGLYTFMYPLICYVAALVIRQIERHIVTVMVLSVVMIVLLELLSYFFASVIALTSIDFGEFFTNRLVPTMIANALFIVMFGYMFKQITEKRFFQKQAGF
ncbi:MULTISPECIES: rod shape-determining protein MreD [unclassified Sporosarcina]|uniref:rod shape-determining protein MreD n=1 Tax=unclassified Sporosarcina TaxID=2647733 RepID=UPI000C170FE4|nr:MULTISPECIES: rod shape-determining protein MreD [unclassified Sporosarcina]PIC98801.1 rod shape-determining protein MreD [Sporosarcina sp. P29]PID07349.1 rod shape-determining protein MreD [Sporosarcina sp. P30]PID10545.1 rod shape-determining protein MreD [Sporosarcina sp. P31]PID13130.1 rod shape-determining protein MreD [Sporosarcina sp. P32b]